MLSLLPLTDLAILFLNLFEICAVVGDVETVVGPAGVQSGDLDAGNSEPELGGGDGPDDSIDQGSNKTADLEGTCDED